MTFILAALMMLILGRKNKQKQAVQDARGGREWSADERLEYGECCRWSVDVLLTDDFRYPQRNMETMRRTSYILCNHKVHVRDTLESPLGALS